VRSSRKAERMIVNTCQLAVPCTINVELAVACANSHIGAHGGQRGVSNVAGTPWPSCPQPCTCMYVRAVTATLTAVGVPRTRGPLFQKHLIIDDTHSCLSIAAYFARCDAVAVDVSAGVQEGLLSSDARIRGLTTRRSGDNFSAPVKLCCHCTSSKKRSCPFLRLSPLGPAILGD
jgi:hypothetical protein